LTWFDAKIRDTSRLQEVVDANNSADLACDLLGYETKVKLREGLTELANWIIASGTNPFDYHLPLEIITDARPKTWREKIM